MSDETGSGDGQTTQTTTETAPDKGGQPGSGQTFTQADLDRIVGERAKRAESAAVSKLLETLGVKDADELAGVVKNHRERSQAEMTETQKMQQTLADLKAKADAADKRAADAEAGRVADKVNSKVETLALKQRAQFPADVVEYLRKTYADDLAKAVGDGGSVDEKAIETLIGKAKADRPNWFVSGDPGSPSPGGGRNPQLDADTKRRAATENRQRIRDGF